MINAKKFLKNNIIEIPSNTKGNIKLEIDKDIVVIIKDSDISLFEENDKNYNVEFHIYNSTINHISFDSGDNLEVSRIFNLYEKAKLNSIQGFFMNGISKSIVNLKDEETIYNSKTVAVCNKEELKTRVEINHLSKNAQGVNENYVIAKNSKIKYDIIGCIPKGMKGSKCSQKTRGIIIEKGIVEADPVLLIDEYDVSANHGASIGKISDEGLFYLMSRGITKEESLLLIVNGFLNPIYNSINDESFKEKFVKASLLKME